MIDEYGIFDGMRTGMEPEVLGINLPQYHYVQHKSHMILPDIKPGSLR
jgi:hypothetical protein